MKAQTNKYLTLEHISNFSFLVPSWRRAVQTS